jgi:hypothetical protein
MARAAKIHQDKLPMLKQMVENYYNYFKKNNERYHEFKKFICDTSLTPEELSKLRQLNKPTLEFNIIEAFISRLRGEFAKHEPELTVRSADGVSSFKLTKEMTQTIEVVEAHLRDVFLDTTNDSLSWKIYKDQLQGGFTVAKVYTDYLNEMSFDQQIKVDRVFDPTLTVFDPMARDSHKGDGAYAGEIIPMTKADFIKHFGKEDIDTIKFEKNLEGFSWSYKTAKGDLETILVCYLYVKESKKKKIAKLSSGAVILSEHYEELQEIWRADGKIEQAPVIVEERVTDVTKIVRYCFCESMVLSYEVTDFKYLPIVFFDGNSETIQDGPESGSYQMTRPYAYHAKGIQKLKNFAGQTVASEIETMVQHKFKVAAESIPEDYEEAYKNVQQASVLVYNAFNDGNINVPLPPPMEIQRTPTPPIVQETFLGSDSVTQAILGSYDAQLGITDNDMSGKAIQQGSMHSSAAAMPYTMGYIQGLNRIAMIMMDYIPKYYRTPRSLPIRKPNGMRSYKVINDPKDPDSIYLDYDSNDLQVNIATGVNTSLQKQMALDQIIRMMEASPAFAQFMNQDGLEILVDNLDIRGIENLKLKAEEYTAKQKQAQEQNAGQPDVMQQMVRLEAETEQARTDQKANEAMMKHSIDIGRLAIDEQKADIEAMKAIADIEAKGKTHLLAEIKHDAQVAKDAIDLALQVGEQANQAEQQMNEAQQVAEAAQVAPEAGV